MIEELELKHVLPYLSYGLMVNTADCKYNEVFSVEMENGDLGLTDNFYALKWVKPLLRPMSDLFESIVHNGEIVCVAKLIIEEAKKHTGFFDWEIENYQGKDVIVRGKGGVFMPFDNPHLLENWTVEILNEHHFDWRYDLLLKGLAEPIVNDKTKA